ncbi:MAG: hypothetical protein QOF63_1362, partial [Thermoanaerobaculia bacterium]|nr:hypothetical protein [Thermoanaerobaculia bacterium]
CKNDAKASPAIRSAMNHDLASRPNVQPPRTSAVGGIWIRHMQRQVVLAIRIAAVDCVQTFGSPPVPLALLRPCRIRSETDVIRAKRPAVSEERQLARRLLDDDSVGLHGHVRGRSEEEASGRDERTNHLKRYVNGRAGVTSLEGSRWTALNLEAVMILATPHLVFDRA